MALLVTVLTQVRQVETPPRGTVRQRITLSVQAGNSSWCGNIHGWSFFGGSKYQCPSAGVYHKIF